MKKAFQKYLSIPMLTSVVLIIVPLAATSFLSVFFVKNEETFLAYSTFEWLSFSAAGIFTQAFALTPPTFVALVLSYFWGWKTLPVLFIINLLAIYLINIIVKMLDHERFVGFLENNPKAQKLMKSIRKEEVKIISLAKLSPVLPFTFTNFVFTLSGAKLRNILLGGFLGMIPRTVMSVWAGTQAKEIRKLLEDPNRNNTQQILVIALIIISAFGLIYVINKAVKRVTD
ncbi:TVP38/TMEM64 family protein [Jiulongibacter sediminis]|uniref:TVP38/TMEM64 family protein n=1 Tax=Jiulongibacter sediminis TaxID=1605367 RepID=UPI0006DD2664|nr:VTT domain-containing protein [Jiulongibacter sediminis]